MRTRLRAAAAALLSTTALVVLPTPPALAQAPDVAVSITSLEPAAPGPGDTLVLAGTVRNASDVVLDNVQALLRYSRDPLEGRTDVRRFGDDPDYRYGRRDERFFQVVADELPPGATDVFRLEVPVDDIGFVEPGVYAVGVDVRGTPSSGGRVTLATERTLLPWMSGVDADPVPVAVLWTLAAPPELLPGGTLRSDDLAGELGPGGALAGLLGAAGDAPVGWLVDPDLLDTVTAMADGYEVESSEGELVPGGGERAAAGWLDSYRATVAAREVAFLPYASPDVVALAGRDAAWAAGIAEQAVDASTAAAAGGGTAGAGGLGPRRPRTDVAAPAGGWSDADGLRALSAAGVTTVVLSGGAVSPTATSAVGRVAAADGSLEAVLTDPGLDAVAAAVPSAAGAGGTGGRAAGVADAVEARQRWLAETALAVLDADSEGEPPRGLVTASPYEWRPEPAVARTLVEAWTTTPWVTPTTLASLPRPDAGADGATDPGDEAAAPDPPEGVTGAQLPAEFVDGVAEAQADAERYLHLLAEPGAPAAELEPAMLRSASAGWRADLVAGRDYLSRVTAGVEEPLTQVSVLVPRAVTLSSRTGVFPLTVANDLAEPVLVDVDLQPDNPDRLSIESVDALRVEAGEKAAVDVRAEAAANGSVPVVVQLATTTGEPLGDPHEIRVVATDYGAIGWVVVGVGALLLVGATAVRVARRQRAPAGVDRETTRVGR